MPATLRNQARKRRDIEHTTPAQTIGEYSHQPRSSNAVFAHSDKRVQDANLVGGSPCLRADSDRER